MSGVYEIRQPSELLITINILQSEMQMSVEDAKVILGYMQGHDFMLALEDGQLVRVDISEEQGARVPYTIVCFFTVNMSRIHNSDGFKTLILQ